MGFWTKRRRCPDAAEIRDELRELRADMENALLRYESLYQSVRKMSSKIAKQVKEAENGSESPCDERAKYLNYLLEKKLRRRQNAV